MKSGHIYTIRIMKAPTTYHHNFLAAKTDKKKLLLVFYGIIWSNFKTVLFVVLAANLNDYICCSYTTAAIKDEMYDIDQNMKIHLWQIWNKNDTSQVKGENTIHNIPFYSSSDAAGQRSQTLNLL